MNRIEQKVLRFIDEKNLIEQNDKILTALSGGPDSVLLLHLLSKYRKRFRIKLGAIHINHKIRGKEADLDEQFCSDFARKLNIQFFSISKKVSQFAKKNKLSLEEAGRKIRYGILESYSNKYKYNKVATAHTSSDNTETVLLNLIKGTGLKGISGIPERRQNIIRPILVLTKEEVLEYLRNENISFRIDETNLNTGYQRNFIRHKIIPELKKINPALEHTLLNSSELFRGYSRLSDDWVEKNYSSIAEFKENVLHFKIGGIKDLSRDLQGEIFKEGLSRNFSVQITFNDFRKFSSLLNKQAGRKESLSGHLSALREREEILVLNNPRTKFIPLKIKEGDEIKFNCGTLSITECDKVFEFNKKTNIEYVSGDDLGKIFTLRRWRPGDRFFPLGLKSSKKVSDFLNERKIPSYLKKNQLVLTNKNRIVWVLGLRIDNRFKIGKKTKKVLQLCLK